MLSLNIWMSTQILWYVPQNYIEQEKSGHKFIPENMVNI